MCSYVFLSIPFFVILTFSIILSIQDVKHKSINIFILIIGIISALIIQIFSNWDNILLFISSSFILGLFYFFIKIITKNKLGKADIYFGIFQGIFLLPSVIPLCLIIESMISLIFVCKIFKEKSFPFIPFMSVGLIISFYIQTIVTNF